MQVDLELEAFHWVPKKAIDACVRLLGRDFPALPVAPFMRLLTQLNRVWLARETAAVQKVTATKDREMRALQRIAAQATPYKQSMAEQRLAFVKGQLKASSAPRFPLSLSCPAPVAVPPTRCIGRRLGDETSADRKVKTLAKYKVKVTDHLADDNRELLRWSLAQLDAVSKERLRSVMPRPVSHCRRRRPASARLATDKARCARTALPHVAVFTRAIGKSSLTPACAGKPRDKGTGRSSRRSGRRLPACNSWR